MARPTGRPTAAAKAAIPQLAWDAVRPAPVVLVSGTETVLADRAIRQLRDILKAEDPSQSQVEVRRSQSHQETPSATASRPLRHHMPPPGPRSMPGPAMSTAICSRIRKGKAPTMD